MMSNYNIILKPEEEQIYIAKTTTNSDLLDILANSDSVLVRMTVLSNPAVSTSTINRKIGDEEREVWQKAQELLDNQKRIAG